MEQRWGRRRTTFKLGINIMQPKRRKPTHPGEILSKEFLKPLQISPKDFAKTLSKDWNEKKVNDLIEGKEAVSKEMAKDLAKALQTTTHFWVHLQQFYAEYEKIQRGNEKGSLKPWKKAI